MKTENQHLDIDQMIARQYGKRAKPRGGGRALAIVAGFLIAVLVVPAVLAMLYHFVAPFFQN